MPERFAIYYAPPADDLLCVLANGWYGRAEFRPLTVSARRYGFHATVKAPFALVAERTRADLETAVATFAATHPAIPIGPLALKSIGGGFLALVPDSQSQKLSGFAGDTVVAFERFRAQARDTDRSARLPGLTPRQVELLLDRYGYPYVMEQYQFHMTLTDRLPDDRIETLRTAAEAWFAPYVGKPLVLDRLVLFHEPEPGAPFVRLAPDYMLGVRR